MSSKKIIAAVLISILFTALVLGFVRNMQEAQEKARLENLVAPVILQSVEGTPDPKPSLFFISPTEKSLVVVLRWEQKPEAAIKNDMRERISTSLRRELSADPKSWGRHISVIFDDEVVTQGGK